VFGDFQNTPENPDEQLLFGDDVLNHHS
jgi:hypothetical protein